tara:strand:- start:3980 stop:5830 length:1851 start_codon:yes stop_codon:yes gene_type:complete
MAYTITNSDNSRTITVQDTTVDTTYALKLIGRNVSGYGQYFVENTVRHLENFASTTSPSGEKLTGQLWFDKSENIMKYWNGTVWKRATNIIVSSSAPGTSNAGDIYFNTDNNKLFVYNGTTYKPSSYSGEVTNTFNATSGVGSPSNYGSKLRNIYLTDSGNNPKPVLALVYVSDGTVNGGATTTADGKETIMAIFSDHDEFVVANDVSSSDSENINYFSELSGTGGIGTTIKPGMNLRSEYAATSVALAERAYKADTAYKINLGNIGSPGSNVDAGSIITTLGSYVPTTDDAFTLGTSGKKFADVFTGAITIGDSSSGLISANGSVDIGTSSSRFANGYFTNLDVSGNVTFGAGTQNLGTNGAPVENFFTANASVTTSLTMGSGGTAYSFPVTDGSANQALVTNGSGTVSFGDVALSSTDFIAGAGLTGGGTLASSRTFDVGAGSYILVAADSISADATTAATANKLVARDGAGNVAANYFVGTATAAQYADLAEKYMADAPYEPGTVVVIGGSAEVTVSSKENDPSIAGIVSTAPAHLMNEGLEGDNAVAVALRGRVPCKVVGVVRKGDVLIQSSTEGHAKAAPFRGYQAPAACIIGKSLEEKSTPDAGVIEVLV